MKQNKTTLDYACNLFSLWCSKNQKLADAFKLLQNEPSNGNIILNMLTISSEYYKSK